MYNKERKAVALLKSPTLWTRNFTIITLGTLASAIGGTAMGLAMSLIVFDRTSSTWLSGLFAAASLFPGAVLPILIAPYVDRCDKKRLIVRLDALSGALYLAFGLYLTRQPFSYPAYLLFSLITGSIGTAYSLAYDALYPDLIPKGFAQKGYAISSMIYPTVTAVVTPAASILYGAYGIVPIVLGEGVLLLIAACFESRIRTSHTPAQHLPASLGDRLRAYGREIGGGIRYVRADRGIRSIYLYMTTTNACSQNINLMAMAHFQTSDFLTTAMYAALISAETLGRMAGGLVHYVFKIPQERRYALTVWVYRLYELLDGALLFLWYPLMLAARFLCGFMGVNTATLRTAAVQNYLPADLRARVNALFNVLISGAMMLAQLAAGALGEVLPYRVVSLLFAALSFAMIHVLIVRNRASVEPIYNRAI